MYTHIFFDLDGTLTDPKEGITNSVAYALASFGYGSADELTQAGATHIVHSFEELAEVLG